MSYSGTSEQETHWGQYKYTCYPFIALHETSLIKAVNYYTCTCTWVIYVQGIAVLVVINFCVYFMCLIRQCQQPLFKHSVCKASHWTETFINTDSELVSINDLYNYTYCMFTVIMLNF